MKDPEKEETELVELDKEELEKFLNQDTPEKESEPGSTPT